MRVKTLCMCLLFFVAAYTQAWAHPPKDIQITFDPATKILKAVLVHDVQDTTKHYLKKVDVSRNGKEIVQQLISRQDDKDAQTISILIPDVNPGDTLGVEGYCNIAGALEKSIKTE